MIYCNGCGGVAGMRKKFRDPRHEEDDEDTYIELAVCSDECELAIIEHLESRALMAEVGH